MKHKTKIILNVVDVLENTLCLGALLSFLDFLVNICFSKSNHNAFYPCWFLISDIDACFYIFSNLKL